MAKHEPCDFSAAGPHQTRHFKAEEGGAAQGMDEMDPQREALLGTVNGTAWHGVTRRIEVVKGSAVRIGSPR